MKLASHNSLSGFRIKNWWLYPLYFISLCQFKSIRRQFSSGVRLFDFYLNPNLELSYGIFKYSIDIEDILGWLNSCEDEVWVRLTLDQDSKLSDQGRYDSLFCNYCQYLEENFVNIKFFGGRRRFDSKELYRFNTIFYSPRILELYGIVTPLYNILPNWLNKLCPFIYSSFNNWRLKKEYLVRDTYDYLMLDFV